MDKKIGRLILTRHGQSTWNKANIFTGKTDVHLTKEGFQAAEELGMLLSDLDIDKVFTSMQSRSIETEVCMMSGSNTCSSENMFFSENLNERDYGKYTGLSKEEIEKELGEKAFEKLRRGWECPIPEGETLKMVYDRAVPYYKKEILSLLLSGKNVLVVSHGNTSRALMKYIENITDEGIEEVEMPFNEALIYEIDKEGHMTTKEVRSIGDEKFQKNSTRLRTFVQIVATIGPASEQPIILEEMIRAGMDIARINFNWPEPEEVKKRVENIKKLAKENHKEVLMLADLPGPRVQGKEGHTYDPNAKKAITEQDKKHIKFAIENNFDFISVSFVGDKDDILDCKKEIEKHGGKQKVIAKIERKVAVENIDSIIEIADAIMIARGDLGNEVPIEKIPFIQKDLIQKCKKAGKPVITATQMLYTMKDNPTPTRAEATDVVNAVLEGTDAIMLSEETSIGKHPIRAVYVMEHLAFEAENHLKNAKFNQL